MAARRPRPVLLLVVLALVMPLSGLVLDGDPATASPATTACPRGAVPATAFEDTLTSTHRAAIDCATWWELVEGVSATSYVPGADVTRGQIAAMIARQLRSSGRAIAAARTAGFEDTVGHLFEDDIDLLAALGIIQGVGPSTYAPDAPVTRAQFASILVRTFARGYDTPLPPGIVRFADVAVDSVHREAIGSLVRADVAAGTSPITFAPGRPLTREQTASFLTRAATILLAEDLVALPTARPASDDAYGSRMRAAWVHLFDDSLKSRAGIQRLVDELVAADATAVIAQVARRHDAYYVSDVLPRTVDPRLTPGLDVLDELLTAAHARGLEVHAWYGVAPTWHGVYADLPAPDGWIAAEHGRDAPVADRWVTRNASGDWSDYLDPGVPAVQAHVAAVVTELVERYPVDGIHLDYVRYSSADVGYNPVALQHYRAQTGATGTPDPDDARWRAWRRAQSRELVRAARGAIDASGRDVTLSAAVITWGAGPATPDRAGFQASLPYTRTLQDWDQWVRDGELDIVLPMNYFRQHDLEQAVNLAGWQAYQRVLATSAQTQVVPGPGGYLNHPVNVAAQVRTSMHDDGAAVYSFQQPTLDASRDVWQRLAATRWGYHPQR